jgi:uncharacterized protein (TIRG00374 family)
LKRHSHRIARILLQIIIMAAIFAALLWYVGIGSLYNSLLNIKLEYLLFAFLTYFGINLLFTVRLRLVLGKEGIKTSFGKTLLAQYAGMLTSDITPGRSGYVLTPLYLRDQEVPTSKSLSGILGIQTIEFLIKVAGGIGALFFLIETVQLETWQFGVAALGIALMLTGAAVLAAVSWSNRAISLFDRIAKSRFLSRFTGGLVGKIEEYKESARKTRKAIPEIILITVTCWILKGFEWYFLGLALGITQIPWIGFFLLHPLITALGFVPITPAGAGVQEFGIVGIFGLLVNVSANPAMAGPIGALAVLSRVLLIVEDLAGVPQIAKSTSILVFSRKLPDKPAIA